MLSSKRIAEIIKELVSHGETNRVLSNFLRDSGSSGTQAMQKLDNTTKEAVEKIMRENNITFNGKQNIRMKTYFLVIEKLALFKCERLLKILYRNEDIKTREAIRSIPSHYNCQYLKDIGLCR